MSASTSSPLLDLVRPSTQRVAVQAARVSLNEEALEPYAATVPLEAITGAHLC